MGSEKISDERLEDLVRDRKCVEPDGCYHCEEMDMAKELLVLRAASEELAKALEKIIEMNRKTAEDQYGDAEKAESWSCVTVARSALRKPGKE